VTATPIYPDLAGKVALVTGGSRGIGAATASALAANGVRVAVNGRDQAAIDGVVEKLADAGGTAIGVAADVCDWSAIESMRKRVEDELGPVDVLVPFAGGFGGMTPVHEISEDEWHSVIESNLTSTFLTVKAFVPGMIERRRGSIVTMASNAGRFLDITLTASYAAAKAGIAMFTRHVAKELGPHGIRANCVAPATSLSERVERIMPDERRAEIAAMAPLGRLGLPEDTASATVFLVSDAAGWLTGITLDIAGGRVML
jgi:NAD(P)-dependent dehydrogenase (short-subunit alcohol dehydrogenase family)